MLDANYFRTRFARHAGETGRAVRVELHLRSRVAYDLAAIREVEEGFVVVAVHPSQATEFAEPAPHGRRVSLEGDAGAEGTDRLVVPYESIAHLSFVPVTEGSTRSVGFQSGRSGA